MSFYAMLVKVWLDIKCPNRLCLSMPFPNRYKQDISLRQAQAVTGVASILAQLLNCQNFDRFG